MALGGLMAVTVAPKSMLAKAALPALMLYLVCPFVTAAMGRYSGFSYLVLYGSGILIAVLLAGIVSDQSSRLVALLEFSPIRYIGTISYGLYLYHDAINIPFLGDIGPHFLHLRALTEIALSIGIASLSWHLIEQPILNYRDKRRQRTEIKYTPVPNQFPLSG
jgi:peptidoglycan/LPS O-acetylase OafA/YrhL